MKSQNGQRSHEGITTQWEAMKLSVIPRIVLKLSMNQILSTSQEAFPDGVQSEQAVCPCMFSCDQRLQSRNKS
jgi:hypothetical protein